MRFVLNPNFSLTQVKYLDLEKNLDDSENPHDKLMSEMTLLTPMYSELVLWLSEQLGGLVSTASTSVDTEALVRPFEEVEETA